MLRVPWGLWFVMLLLSWVRPAAADWPPASPTTWGASCAGGASCSGGGTFASKAAAIASVTTTCSGYTGGTGTPTIDASDLATVNAVPFVGGALNCNNSLNLAQWAIAFNGTCPSGATVNTTSGLCENTACVTGAASRTIYNYRSTTQGSTSAPCPSVVCSPAGCEAVVLSCGSFGMTLTGGTSPSTMHTGSAQITAQPCGSAVITIAIGGTSNNTSGAAAGGAVGGGTGGTGTGFNASDALNLQAIARNTSGLAGTGVSDAVAAAGAATVAELQAQSAANSDASDTASAAITGSASSVASTLSGQVSDLAPGGGPDIGSGARLSLSAWPFVSAGIAPVCELAMPFSVGGFSTSALNIDVCTWGHYFSDFLYWALGLLTLVGVFSILYRGS